MQVDVLERERGTLAAVGERDVLEVDRAAQLREIRRLACVEQVGLLVQQLEDLV